MIDTKKEFKLGAMYIRESTEEQDSGFSPENQERAIREYAERNGITVLKIYKDLKSGKLASKRSEFLEMIDDASKKSFDVILVYHTSRFARNVKEARSYKEKLRLTYKVDVISVTQHFGDWEDPGAFLNEGINELFDAYYSQQLAFWIKGACQEKRQQGKQLGNPPLGYYKKVLDKGDENNPKRYDKKWKVNKKEAELVKKIFELYATGEYSLADIAKRLNEEGYKTKYGNMFTYDSVRGIVKNKVYLGLVHSPRKDYPDLASTNHPQIISQDLFDQANAIRESRRNSMGRPVAQHRFYLLQGLVYCYDCYKQIIGKEDSLDKKMVPKMYSHASGINYKTKKETKHYTCKFRKEAKSCRQSTICRKIDRQMIKMMSGFQISEDIINLTLENLNEMMKYSAPEKKRDNTIAKLETKKKRLGVMFKDVQEIDEKKYIQEIQSINGKLARLKKNEVDTPKRIDKKVIIRKSEKFLKDFNTFWNNELDDMNRQKWIRVAIKRIWVKNDNIIAVEPHEHFVGLFVSYRKVIVQAPLATRTENTPILGCFCLENN